MYYALVLLSPFIAIDNNFLVPTNELIVLVYISPCLAPTCFCWSPSSGSSQPNIRLRCTSNTGPASY